MREQGDVPPRSQLRSSTVEAHSEGAPISTQLLSALLHFTINPHSNPSTLGARLSR